MTLNFWRENVNQLLTFQGEDLLQGNGNVTNEQMEELVGKVYEAFDSNRKRLDAVKADEEDIKLLDNLANEVKNRRRE